MPSPRLVYILAAGVFSCAQLVCAQDAPIQNQQSQNPQSLGDVARQTRVHREQQEAQAPANPPPGAASWATSKDAQGSAASGPSANAHVVTNDDIPEHSNRPGARVSQAHSGGTQSLPNYKGPKHPAEYWRSQILQLKNSIALKQKRLDMMNESLHFAGSADTSVIWNERQRQKQGQADLLKTELDQEHKRLEDMQESARKEGYGSSVYEP